MFLEINVALEATIAVLLLIISYLFGSIPFGLVIGKLFKGVDIREYGSKNIGSTNAIRVLGKKLGFTVFFFDVLKGALIILIVKLLEATGAWYSPIEHIFYGVAAIIGHSFSIFLGFKGGKAVATSLGAVLVVCPIAAVSCLIVFGILFYATGYVSVCSTGATLTVFTASWILYGVGIKDPQNFAEYLIASPGLAAPIILSFVGLLIIVKHKKNYIRLINGTENSFKRKKNN